MRTIKDLDRAALTLSQIVELLLDESIDSNEVRAIIFDTYLKLDVLSAISKVKTIVRNEQEPIAIAELYSSYRKFRKYIPDILET